MKDFFDIFYLSSMFDFDGSILCEALKQTLEHRGRVLEEDIFERLLQFDAYEHCRCSMR